MEEEENGNDHHDPIAKTSADDEDDDDDTTTVGDANDVGNNDENVEEDDEETSSEDEDITTTPDGKSEVASSDASEPDSESKDNDDDDDETSNPPAADTDNDAAAVADDDNDDDSANPPPTTKPPKLKPMRIKLKMPKPNAARNLSSEQQQLQQQQKQQQQKQQQKQKPSKTTAPSTTGKHAQSDPKQPTAKKARVVLHPSLSRKNQKNKSSVAGKGSSDKSTTPATGEKPSKSRIRSLKLPLSQKALSETVQATVVNSDDEEEGEAVSAVATVVSSSTAATPSAAAAAANKIMKRRLGPVRVRIPPLVSPGLRILSSQSSKQQESYTTPAEIFDQAMASAGYTLEARTDRPHRGSSVGRVVGDMFDSNVKLSLHFPPLVPPEMRPKPESSEEVAGSVTTNGGTDDVANRHVHLVQALRSAKQNFSTTAKSNGNSRKRSRQWTFSDMVPVPLTIPYPEIYIKDQLEYVRQVQEREKAIIRKQEAEEEQKADDEGTTPKIEVPPIPKKPTPPTMTDQPGFIDEYEDNYPLFFPKSHPEFVSHLDKNCFHITEGRYFGLWTNKIADPNFVGPNAPGIAGVNSAGGAGLATCTSGSGSTSTALTLTSSFPTAALSSTVTSELVTSTELTEAEPPPVKKATISTEKKAEKKLTVSEPVKKQPAPTPTASTSSLRKVMEEGGSSASFLRQRIIRAAVHASRTGNHGQPFTAGEKVYPDIGKAFAAHAGIKPCPRCKNNKQGAYHCRLRRKHFDNDFDGGDSMSELKPLFELPMDELLSDGE